ncbi:DUF724 domain-containing protein 3-like [Cynara cardunculus var. scolymus]|uniref:Agenet-like domain-containing protein n=1 Tax=Cynara cardunculus var. scolymus TaxID=59895 RepID=A0A103YGJ9_CYNCS|nr:DUF724 domain-containing protein 3-like [Cynara cardunculus var. scolymus]XP_024985957.1 DUF724 domain-containing protein 3-like [Cynara cardunculus var. scolymus]XP_024985966.1 DUF724 domain-containing protein 3-like [Cynara cardunculus var. scolymus]XP_024985974.1 DUF724 domain-containing protein 3-like [Cynara cardunculus var. scolymus]KVI08697.1 Agenet-like domain-containing protein [Cynara cardunculus var. scolymus]
MIHRGRRREIVLAMRSPASIKKEASASASASSTTMAFERGDRVEILSEEEGFVGSYFTANIITWLMDEEYIVQYRTLLKDDGSGPLREVVSADQIQPLPPEIPATGFSLADVVDAYDKDGWWVGTISGKKGSNYFVYFESTEEENAYPLRLLRIHQDWVDGAWLSSKN